MIDVFDRIQRFVRQSIWQGDIRKMPRAKRIAFSGMRILYVMVRELTEGQLALHAMSLVYTTLLSLVPLLAVSFSVLKAFGVNQIDPILMNLLAPLGEQGREITDRIIGFVENMRVGVLGSLGLGFLLYTVISLVQKIEVSFNYVWRVKQVRSFARRFSDYLSVIIVGPVLVFTAIGFTASIMSTDLVQQLIAMEPFGTAVLVASRVMPYLLISAAFTFFYMFVPNTTVRFRSALVGGLVGGALWQLTGFAFASFVAGSTRYAAIYSSFAILFLFMIWLYLSWFILLFGSQIAYYHQHPQQVRRETEQLRLSDRLRDRIGLAVMYLVTRAYEKGEPGWTLDALAQRLGVPGDAVIEVADDLLRLGYLLETSADPPGYVPGRDPELLSINMLLAGLRSAGEEQVPRDEQALSLAPVEGVLAEAEQALARQFGERSIKDLVRDEPGSA